MRRLLAVLLLFAFAAPAFGGKSLNIRQLDEFLAAGRGKPDADFAYLIADLQLTERLSASHEATLASTLPGDKCRKALRALADESQFLATPANAIPMKAAPDVSEQKRLLALFVTYVKETIPRLPNFIATRRTDRYEDTPLVQLPYAPFIPYQPIHYVGSVEATVVYRDGRDVASPVTLPGKKPEPEPPGLTTWGVFGPILGTVLVDAAQSTLVWDSWDHGHDDLIATFRFVVPKVKSHYEVNYCCVANGQPVTASPHPFREVVGYHGTLGIDPATGTIVRLVVEAELRPSDPVSDAAILVEYGRVEIGGKSYICPLRSLSRSHAQIVQVDPQYHIPLANQMQPVKLSLNESTFRAYQIFRADARILINEAENATKTTVPATSQTPDVAHSPVSETPDQTVGASPARAAEDAHRASGADSTAVLSAAPINPNTLMAGNSAANMATPEVELSAGQVQDAITAPSTFTLRTTTRLVDVAVVVYDGKGRPVTNLKPDDLEVFDNGRRQNVRSFTMAGAADADSLPVVAEAHSASDAQPKFANRAGVGAPTKQAIGATVLMIDSSNLAFGDWTYARNEMLRFLKTLPADEPLGLYVLRSRGFRVLLEPSVDHAQVAAVLAKWMPTAQDMSNALDEESRNRQQQEYVHSISDLFYVNGNVANGQYDARTTSDPQLRSLGSDPEGDAFATIPAIARHLAAVSGHKSLVWVASDNVLADWSDQTPNADKDVKTSAPMVLRAQEALNDAHVSIYPLDASQLEAGGVSAAQSQGNVQLVPTADAHTQLSIQGGETQQDRQELGDLLEKSQHNLYPGRISAQMKQDLHPIATEYRELAAATGGRAFRRASDLAAEMADVVADGRAAYILSFTPDKPPDDAYHQIAVKLAAGRTGTVRYRTGYFYAKEPDTMKDRLQQAIWQPGDARDIAMTATPARDRNAPTLKLTVDATDLALVLQGGLWMDKLDVLLVERDDATQHAKIIGATAALRLRPETYRAALREGLAISLHAPAVPAGGVVRVILIDENNGRTGSVTIPASALHEAS